MALPLELTVIHPDPTVCEALSARLDGIQGTRVVAMRYEALGPHDCFVTAGNAYGIMNAGIDAAVVARHGEALMARVQDRIRGEYLGEQPVGTAFLVETDDPERPFLAHAPTMRTPGSIAGTDRVYVATWAALLAIYRHNVVSERTIRTVVFPVMGAGFGGVAHSESGRQMAAAFRHYQHPPYRLDWDLVARRQKAITEDAGSLVVPRS